MPDRLDTQPSPQTPAQRPHVVPAGTADLGMWLFLGSLTLLFLASLVAYTLIRLLATKDRTNRPAVSGAAEDLGQALPLGSIHLPWPLWVSTGVIILTGFLMQRALNEVRREHIVSFRNTLVATLGMSMLFVVIQTPALIWLMMERQALGAGGAFNNFLFFLIVLHAAHVIGGLIPLFKITLNAHEGRYDHEHYGPIRIITRYWHFLDAVWIVMFGLFVGLEVVWPWFAGFTGIGAASAGNA